MGVIVFVGIGVGTVVWSVVAIWVEVETVASSLFSGAGDFWIVVAVGVTWLESRGNRPQACKRIIKIHTKKNPLSTLAVYHNNSQPYSKLSPW